MQPFSMVHNIIVYCVLILKKNKQWSAGEQKPSRHRRVGLCGQRGKLGPALSGADWGGAGSCGRPLSLFTNKQNTPGGKFPTDHLHLLNIHVHHFYSTIHPFQPFLLFDVDNSLAGAVKCF